MADTKVKLTKQFNIISATEASSKPLRDIFIIDTKGMAHRTSDLYFKADNNSPTRKIKTFSDLQNAIKGYIYTSNNDASQIKIVEQTRGSMKSYYSTRNYEIPASFESDSVNGADRTITRGRTTTILHDTVPVGIKRTLELKRIPSVSDFEKDEAYFSKTEYFMVKAGGRWMRVHRSEIGIYNGIEFISLDHAKNKIKSFEQLNNVDISVTPIVLSHKLGGYTLEEIGLESALTVGRILDYERINTYTMTRETIERKEDGTEAVKANLSKPLDRELSEHIFVPPVDNAEATLNVKTFSYDENGNVIKVVLSDGTTRLVSLDKLLEVDIDGKATDKTIDLSGTSDEIKDKLSKLVGKQVAFELDGKKYISAPLTYEQTIMRYTSNKYMNATNVAFDEKATDPTYLRLKNGKYVEEQKAIRPICYDYVKNEDYEKLSSSERKRCRGLVILDSGETRIVDISELRSKYSSLAPSRKSIITPSTKAIADCDVIQTTNVAGAKTHKCTLLNNPDSTPVFSTEDEKNDAIKSACETFLAGYKSNDLNSHYQLDEVLVDGKFEPLSDQGQRYQITDTYSRPFHAKENDDYKYLKKSPLVINNGKLEGGVRYDTAGAIKDFYKSWGAFFGGIMAFTFSVGGIITALAAPVLLGGAMAALVVSAIVGLIYHAIKGRRMNSMFRKGKKFADTAQLQRDGIETEVKAELQDILNQVKDLTNTSEKGALSEIQKELVNVTTEIEQLEAEQTRLNSLVLHLDTDVTNAETKLNEDIAMRNTLDTQFTDLSNEMLSKGWTADDFARILSLTADDLDLALTNSNIALSTAQSEQAEAQSDLDTITTLQGELQALSREFGGKTPAELRAVLKTVREPKRKVPVNTESEFLKIKKAKVDAKKTAYEKYIEELARISRYEELLGLGLDGQRANAEARLASANTSMATAQDAKDKAENEREYRRIKEELDVQDNVVDSSRDRLQEAKNAVSDNNEKLQETIAKLSKAQEKHKDLKAQKEDYRTAIMERIDATCQKILETSPTEYHAEFTVTDGKAEINDSNAALAQEYMQKYRAAEKKLKEVEKRHKKGNATDDELNKAKDELEVLKNYHASTSESKDNDYQKRLTMAKRYKAFIELKTFGTEDEKKALKDYDFNTNTGEIVYTGKLTGKKSKERQTELKSKLSKALTLIDKAIEGKLPDDTPRAEGKVGEIKTFTNEDELKDSLVTNKDEDVKMPTLEKTEDKEDEKTEEDEKSADKEAEDEKEVEKTDETAARSGLDKELSSTAIKAIEYMYTKPKYIDKKYIKMMLTLITTYTTLGHLKLKGNKLTKELETIYKDINDFLRANAHVLSDVAKTYDERTEKSKEYPFMDAKLYISIVKGANKYTNYHADLKNKVKVGDRVLGKKPKSTDLDREETL